jgi:hypothetical protein
VPDKNSNPWLYHDKYNWKSDVDQRKKRLHKDGFNVRVVSTPLEEYRYIMFKRKKK